MLDQKSNLELIGPGSSDFYFMIAETSRMVVSQKFL